MSKLDESGIIKALQKILGNPGFRPEDVEFFCAGNKKIAVKVDTMVQSTDIPSKMKISDAARKSIVACVSDFASKGTRPLYCIISLNLPKGTSNLQVRQIAQGFEQASDEFGIKILGGDTNQGIEFVFHVCMFGIAQRIIPRMGASPDDLIFVTGPFGYAAAGLEILQKGLKAGSKFRRDASRSFARPHPKLDFGIKAKKYFTSSMDSSDGLSVTLNEMANQSSCKFVIDCVPAGQGVQEFALLNKVDAERLIFHGGEEYEFVFTVPKKYRAAIQKSAQLTKTSVLEIGYVEKGSGVFVKKDTTLKRLRDMGWHHFKK